MSTIDELIDNDIAEYKRSNHFERDVKYAMTALELYRWGRIEEGIKKIDAEENVEDIACTSTTKAPRRQ